MAEKNVILKNTAGDTLYPEIAAKNKKYTINLEKGSDGKYSITNLTNDEFENICNTMPDNVVSFVISESSNDDEDPNDIYPAHTSTIVSINKIYTKTYDIFNSMGRSITLTVNIEGLSINTSNPKAVTLSYARTKGSKATITITVADAAINNLIKDGSIATAKLADGAITENKLDIDLYNTLCTKMLNLGAVASAKPVADNIINDASTDKSCTLYSDRYNRISFMPSSEDPENDTNVNATIEISPSNNYYYHIANMPDNSGVMQAIGNGFFRADVYEGCIDVYNSSPNSIKWTKNGKDIDIIWNQLNTSTINFGEHWSIFTHYEYKITAEGVNSDPDNIRYYGSWSAWSSKTIPTVTVSSEDAENNTITATGDYTYSYKLANGIIGGHSWSLGSNANGIATIEDTNTTDNECILKVTKLPATDTAISITLKYFDISGDTKEVVTTVTIKAAS